MAQVTVFVDDAVRGRLPPVCVKDGTPTVDRLTFTQELGASRLGAAWLLVLLGPVGWVVLIALAVVAGSRLERLTVTLPFGEPAYRRLSQARRQRRLSGWTAVGAVVAGGAALLGRTLDWRLVALGCGLVALVALVRFIVESVRAHRESVRLDLDASRRWVTLIGVHPEFAAAVAEYQLPQRSPSPR